MTADEFSTPTDTSAAPAEAVSGELSNDAAMEAAWNAMQDDDAGEGDQLRGEDGKFAAKEGEETKTAELEGAAEGEEPKDGNSAVTETDVPLPSNLYGLDAEWASLTPEARARFAERSNELNARMSDMGRQVSQFKPLQEASAEFAEYFNGNLKGADGNPISAADGIRYLANIQRSMDRDPANTLMNIIDTYGARQQVAQLLGVQAAPVDSTNRELLSKIDRLEAIISKANDPSNVESIIENRELRSEGQRLKDSEPLVKEIPTARWDFFVKEGAETLGPNATVKAVFDYAVKAAIEADPALRAKTQAAKQAATGDKQKAEAAKRATGVNVTSTSTGKARTLTDDEAMNAKWAEMGLN